MSLRCFICILNPPRCANVYISHSYQQWKLFMQGNVDTGSMFRDQHQQIFNLYLLDPRTQQCIMTNRSGNACAWIDLTVCTKNQIWSLETKLQSSIGEPGVYKLISTCMLECHFNLTCDNNIFLMLTILNENSGPGLLWVHWRFFLSCRTWSFQDLSHWVSTANCSLELCKLSPSIAVKNRRNIDSIFGPFFARVISQN